MTVLIETPQQQKPSSSLPTRSIWQEDNGRSMSPEEFDAIEDDDDHDRYDLIRGALIVSPMAGPGEWSPNDNLGFLLRTDQRFHPQRRRLDDTL